MFELEVGAIQRPHPDSVFMCKGYIGGRKLDLMSFHWRKLLKNKLYSSNYLLLHASFCSQLVNNSKELSNCSCFVCID
jgi:hypothetical protein